MCARPKPYDVKETEEVLRNLSHPNKVLIFDRLVPLLADYFMDYVAENVVYTHLVRAFRKQIAEALEDHIQ